MSKEIAEEYASSLADLTVNSKPLINMLTILAEENIDHAGVIVETVEKHLEKVHPDIKLPVLYLVDSIIKNVGGAYIQKFSQSIVNMFTRTFKQVDEKIRSQMFKLRETWHDVFPATKLYQLDVKVNLIDPAWPIQAQPQQSNIHTVPTTSSVPPTMTEEERSIIAKKEQELLMLQKKKIEMELEQTRKQLELAEKNAKKINSSLPTAGLLPTPMPVAMVNPVVTPPVLPVDPAVPIKQRLGPPVNKSGARIAPVSAALAAARRDPRRDPRLARQHATHHATQPPTLPATLPAALPVPPNVPPVAHTAPIVPNMFDIKPLERVIKRKNVITIDVRPDASERRVMSRDLRRRDADKREPRRDRPRGKFDRRRRDERKPDAPPAPDAHVNAHVNADTNGDTESLDALIDKMQVPDPKKIVKLPPIPKIQRAEPARDPDAPIPKRRREVMRDKKKRNDAVGKDEPNVSSPDKKPKGRDGRKRKEARAEEETEETTQDEVVVFKELKNYHKERYMRRNKEKSESPEILPEATDADRPAADSEPSSVPDVVVENKDVDLRVLQQVGETPAPIGQKRPSTEALEGKAKKNKLDKFDILFGNEDVDLRKLPQVDEANAPPPPSMAESPERSEDNDTGKVTPPGDAQTKRDWNEVKESKEKGGEGRKSLSKLDLVRAKLAEATKGKDRLGRPLLFSKSPSVEKERRRTLSSEDTDIRNENGEEFDAEDHKKTISIIMSQAKEQFSDGQLDKNQYNTLMYQVLQLNEKLKLKEAKQRESLEQSKRKLKAHINDENHKVPSPKSSPNERNNFGDIDERINPAVFMDTPPDSQGYLQDLDMRMNSMDTDGHKKGLLPIPTVMPVYGYQPIWRGQPRPRTDEYIPRRFRAPVPPFFRTKFDKRIPRPGFDPRLPLPLPTPIMGMSQGENPLQPYVRSESPPPLGAPGFVIPPTEFKILDYIQQDPVKTIQIDGVPREIRFYGDTAVIMLDWDDPREIKFFPGCRRVTFDNKDSVVLSFNEEYKKIDIDDQVFDIKFGAPTRELFINGRWFECFFGGQPLGVIIDGKPRLVHLEGPVPQVDIGKTKRTDLVAGKINLIVNATQMCPVYLDAKVQKFTINGQFFTIRFVDSLQTVLINEQPFKVEFGDLPKPITIGKEKYFIRFSALPRNVKPGLTQIANMEGATVPIVKSVSLPPPESKEPDSAEPVEEPARPVKTPSPDLTNENQGLDMLASVMPSSIAPASASEYSLAEPLFAKPDNIPGLEAPVEENPPNTTLTVLGNINVNDLFAKLLATGIVQLPAEKKEEKVEAKVDDLKQKPRDDKNIIHRVDLMKTETLRVKQPGIVSKLYGGMQCSGCGTRFPPEHTVRYSQHLDWHFRQNRRERDSARRAHSRHWHYDLSDWLQYEELEELDEREKNWFESGGAGGGGGGEAEESLAASDTPSAAAGAPAAHRCALCGDAFHQFYNEDKEEWHLRNALAHHHHYYHPLCLDDYKASLTKEETIEEEKDEEIVVAEKVEEEAIEIKDVDESLDQSDNESVVEVIEPGEPQVVESLEIDEGDEDDVVLKAEPIEQVVVEDDADTDDETVATRAERDRRAEIDFSKIKIKQEPIDPDDEPIITNAQEGIQETIDVPHTTVHSSIDGNVQFDATPTLATTLPLGGIRINISKTIPSFIANNDDKMLEDISADDEPLPPGEEPELEYNLKPALEGVHFSKQPPVQRGNELSGLCSIM